MNTIEQKRHQWYLDKFADMTQTITQPGYQPTATELLNYDALRHKLEQYEDTNRAAQRRPRLLESALYYAKHYRWAVFPLRPGSKLPATPNGFKDATTDLERIRRYWERNPTANIGLPTGINFDVIDLDTYKPGADISLQQLIGLGELPQHYGEVGTASGGKHYYVKPTGDGNKADLLTGVDYRGKGGYVVAPPSIVDGQPYAWVEKPRPEILGAA